MDFNSLISYITSPELQETLLPLKVISLFLSLFFLAFIIFALLKTKWLEFSFLEDLSELLTFRPYGFRKIAASWKKIIKRIDARDQSEYKVAIIEADGMLNEILQKMGFIGKSLDDKLKQLDSNILSNIDQVWEAHNLYNDIINDPDFKLGKEETQKVLNIYEQALKELQIL